MHMKGKVNYVYLCKVNEWVLSLYIYIYVTHKRGTDRLFINIYRHIKRDIDSSYIGMHIYKRVGGIIYIQESFKEEWTVRLSAAYKHVHVKIPTFSTRYAVSAHCKQTPTSKLAHAVM